VRSEDSGAALDDVSSCASFDQPVSFIEALVTLSSPSGRIPDIVLDGPDGGKVTFWCGIYIGLGPLPPGDVTATIRWSANNGNGFSEGHATAYGGFTVPGTPPTLKKTPEQKADLGHASNAMKVACAVIAIGGVIIAIASAGVGTPAVAAVMTLLGAGACAWMAASLSDMAIDPPDADYKVTVVPHNPDLAALTSSLKLDGATATAFNALRAHWEAEAGLSEAMVAALYKSEGAAAAGDSQWESTQTLAAAGFAKQLAADLNAEPALRAAVATAIGSAGGPITKDAIDKE
jgi:hypothetical protein